MHCAVRFVNHVHSLPYPMLLPPFCCCCWTQSQTFHRGLFWAMLATALATVLEAVWPRSLLPTLGRVSGTVLQVGSALLEKCCLAPTKARSPAPSIGLSFPCIIFWPATKCGMHPSSRHHNAQCNSRRRKGLKHPCKHHSELLLPPVYGLATDSKAHIHFPW